MTRAPVRSDHVRVGRCRRPEAILGVMRGPGATPITPDSLARERSADIPAGTAPLTPEEAGSLAAGVAGEWQVDNGEIRREFTFKTFNAAYGMATRIALLAEAQGHHPGLIFNASMPVLAAIGCAFSCDERSVAADGDPWVIPRPRSGVARIGRHRARGRSLAGIAMILILVGIAIGATP